MKHAKCCWDQEVIDPRLETSWRHLVTGSPAVAAHLIPMERENDCITVALDKRGYLALTTVQWTSDSYPVQAR